MWLELENTLYNLDLIAQIHFNDDAMAIYLWNSIDPEIGRYHEHRFADRKEYLTKKEYIIDYVKPLRK